MMKESVSMETDRDENSINIYRSVKEINSFVYICWGVWWMLGFFFCFFLKVIQQMLIFRKSTFTTPYILNSIEIQNYSIIGHSKEVDIWLVHFSRCSSIDLATEHYNCNNQWSKKGLQLVLTEAHWGRNLAAPCSRGQHFFNGGEADRRDKAGFLCQTELVQKYSTNSHKIKHMYRNKGKW